jgi:hypothetical protein
LACASSIGLGLLLCFGLPVLAMLALVTVVGIPLGIGLLAALLLIYALGYSAAAWVLGRSVVRGRTGWAVAFLAGWAILRLLALIPIPDGLVWFAGDDDLAAGVALLQAAEGVGVSRSG